MGTDVTGVIVAVVGVAGTMGGTLVTQRMAMGDRRLEREARKAEADAQRQLAIDEREVAARVAQLVERKALYVELNAAARVYRSTLVDSLTDLIADRASRDRDDPPIPEAVREASESFADAYNRAQMVLEEGTLGKVSEVNRCLGLGYILLGKCRSEAFDSDLVLKAIIWCDGDCADAILLLRHVLRAELGVVDIAEQHEVLATRLTAARKLLYEQAVRRPDDPQSA